MSAVMKYYNVQTTRNTEQTTSLYMFPLSNVC